jgi:spore maturation protein CgeB
MRYLFLGGLYPQLAQGLIEAGDSIAWLPKEPGEPEGFPRHMRWLLHVQNARRNWSIVDHVDYVVKTKQVDVVVVFKGYEGHDKRIPPEMGEILRRKGVTMVYWSLDDPFFEQQVAALQTHARPSAYDVYLTCDGETLSRAAGRYRATGLLWPGYDPIEWSADGVEPDSGPDVAVVGSVYRGPLWGSLDRVEYVKAVHALGLRVEVYGPEDWLETGIPPETYKGWLTRTENGRMARAAKVCISSHVRRSRDYLNARTFQVMGAGGVLLTDRQIGMGEGLQSFLVDGDTCSIYDGLEDAVNKTAILTGLWTLRDHIRRRAKAVIYEGGHLYRDRASELRAAVARARRSK